MGSEAYSEIIKSKALGKSRKLANVANEVAQLGYRMKDYQMAMEALNTCADEREYLTAPIKARIQEGTYQIDADRFAEKLLKGYQGR